MEARKKHFAAKRAKEERSKPPTKAQKRTTMSTYLKNMAGYKANQLKNKSYNDIQKLFDRAIKRVNQFLDMDTEVVEVNIIPDEEEVAIDAIPLATKPPVIVDYKIHKEKKISYYKITTVDRSSKMYKVFSQLLKSFNREDLETLWRLVKAKHGNTRPQEGYDRVFWGDLKVMFEPHVEDAMWRDLREGKVLTWKLFDSCGVHFVRFDNLQDYMLVEKKYSLTPATITDMLNKKLQADHLNQMCYQLLKLITRQLKNQ
ncbi:hypothetical protein Tco_1117318 [Tanacetum coccineum]